MERFQEVVVYVIDLPYHHPLIKGRRWDGEEYYLEEYSCQEIRPGGGLIQKLQRIHLFSLRGIAILTVLKC
ncbi:hypothetical protein CW306_06775 [Bacillus sp. BA3]|nr:hypothetical protein CW306_06775 [Bacillus sp. BA3]